MDMIPVKPERKAQLEDYAKRHGQQDTAAALKDVLADYFAWEQQDYREAVEGIQRGYEDMKAGRTRPAEAINSAARAAIFLRRAGESSFRICSRFVMAISCPCPSAS